MPDPEYALGAGRTRTTGPVVAAYADTGAIDKPCPHCGAKPAEFCRHKDGQERKMPCNARLADK